MKTAFNRKNILAVIGSLLTLVVVFTLMTAQNAEAVKRKPKVDKSYSKTYSKYKKQLGTVKASKKCGLKDRGCYQKFSRGMIYSSRHSSPNPVYGTFYNVWKKQRSEKGALGYPTGAQYKSKKRSGYMQKFQGGYITSRSGAGTRIITGKFLSKWKALGWEGGQLGYPNGAERGGLTKGGYVQSFEKGLMYRASKNATGYAVKAGMRTTYAKQGYERGALGYPTSDEKKITGGTKQTFQGGTLYWSSATGIWTVKNNTTVSNAWRKFGAEKSSVGYPKSNETSISGGVKQTYRNGDIYASSATGGHIIKSNTPIANAWKSAGAEKSALGYPKNEENAITGGSRQSFRNGDIYYSTQSKKAVTMMNGTLTSTWLKMGGHASALGYPVSALEKTVKDGDKQSFEKGHIVQNPYSGTYFVVSGDFRTVWVAQGSEKGDMGFPLSDAERNANGIIVQKFGGGSIYKSGYGTFAVTTEFMNEADKNNLGYPVSNVSSDSTGLSQKFRCGVVTYSSSKGTSSTGSTCGQDQPAPEEPKPADPKPADPKPSTPTPTPTPKPKGEYEKPGVKDVTAETSQDFFNRYAALRAQNGYIPVPKNRFITGNENYAKYGASSLDAYAQECLATLEKWRDTGVAMGHVNGWCNSNVNAYSARPYAVQGDYYADAWWNSMGHRGVLYDLPKEEIWKPTATNPNGLCLTYRAARAWDGWTDPQDEFYYNRAVASWVVCPTPR